MTCPQCGRELAPDALFCDHCGAKQKPAEPASAEAADAPAAAPADEKNSAREAAEEAAPAKATEVLAAQKTVVAKAAPNASAADSHQTRAPKMPAGVHPVGKAAAAATPVEKTAAMERPKPAGAPEPPAGAPEPPAGAPVAAQTTPASAPADTTTSLEDAVQSLASELTPEDIAATSVAAKPIFADPDDEPDLHPAPVHTTARVGLVVAGVICAVAAVALVAFLTWRFELWGGKTVPSVVGLDAPSATTALEAAGFKTTLRDVISDEQPGIVVSQDPAASMRVEAGSTIALGVSKERTVPDVEGLQVEAAREALAAAGVSHVRLEYENSDADKGTVVALSPAAGTVVGADDLVTLIVAQPYTVPNVMGMSAKDAVAAIEKAGLVAKVVYVSSEKPANTVVAIEPSATTELKQAATVTISVSSPYPASLYAAASYLTTQPADLATYLKQEGYELVYGSSDGESAVGTWEGRPSAPVITIAPDPFGTYRGFTFWPYNPLERGDSIDGIRLTITQESAPPDVGVLKADQATITRLMNACSLTSTAQTTTTADQSTVVPDAPNAPAFAAKAGEQDGITWAIVVTQQSDGSATADIVCAKTDPLDRELRQEGYELSGYGNSMANLAAWRLAIDTKQQGSMFLW